MDPDDTPRCSNRTTQAPEILDPSAHLSFTAQEVQEATVPNLFADPESPLFPKGFASLAMNPDTGTLQDTFHSPNAPTAHTGSSA